MKDIGYGFVRLLEDLSFEDAIARLTETLKAEGFGVLTEIDVQATLKKKIDTDFRQYKILGACNPHLAHQALQMEEQLGLLLPCNIVVQVNADGKTVVSALDPVAMFQMVKNDEMTSLAGQVREKVRRAVEAI